MPENGTLPRRIESRRRTYERLVVGTLLAGVALLQVGLGAALFAPAPLRVLAPLPAAVGALLLMISLELGHPLQTLRTIGLKRTMGASYDRFKRWPVFKTTSITLNLLTIVAAVALATGLSSRLGFVRLGTALGAFTRASTVVASILAINLAVSCYQSLRTPSRPVPLLGPVATAGFQTLVASALGLGALSVLVARAPVHLGPLTLRGSDSTFLLLATLTLLSLALFTSRPLLTMYAIFVDPSHGHRAAYDLRQKGVLLPVTVAFSLLFIVLLLALVFQLGLARLVEEIPRNGFLMAVVAFMGLALAGAVWATLLVARSDDQPRLFRTLTPEHVRRERWFLGLALGAAALLVVAALLVGLRVPPAQDVPQRLWLDLLVFAVLVAAGPYGFHYARRIARIRRLEERFPDFLRDIAASRKAGLTLPAAVTIAARGEYGELTPEIRKLADQLSLNVPFEEALTRFGQRVDTPLVQRAVVLINEAGRSGGQVTDVLHAAAVDAREIKTLENERHSTMMLYTIIIYIIFGVFLFVCAVLYGTFVPEYLKASQAAAAQGATKLGAVVLQGETKEGYRGFYYVASLVQAVGNGFIAGLIGTGKALAGLRHSFVMVLVTYVTFSAFLP